jgi:hypothetical protein
MRRVVSVLGLLIGLYLLGRAAVEPFLINMSDPATYRNAWGGPSLAGVLAVHCLPGILAGVVIVIALLRRGGRGGNGQGGNGQGASGRGDDGQDPSGRSGNGGGDRPEEPEREPAGR